MQTSSASSMWASTLLSWVSVTSKCHEYPVQHVWEYSADATFTFSDDRRGNTLDRGSRVTLHLREDAHGYLSVDKIKESAKMCSQFIQFPIYVKVRKEVDADTEEDDDDKDDLDEEKKDDVETKDDEAKTRKRKTRTQRGRHSLSGSRSILRRQLFARRGRCDRRGVQ